MRIEGRGEDYGVLHFRSPETQSLIEFLRCNLGNELGVELSVESSAEHETISKLLWIGAVYVDNQRTFDPEHLLRPQADVRVHTSPRRFEYLGSLNDRIVYACDDYLVVDKPSGLPVHALTDNARENLLCLLEAERAEKLFITHRLDVETTGLLIVARSKNAQSRINSLISRRQVKRLYHAWTVVPVVPGTYIHFMTPSPKAPKVVSLTEHKGWARCQLTIKNCLSIAWNEMPAPLGLLSGAAPDSTCYKSEIELQTGRTQQIRAQLAAIGAPIVGDFKYGGLGVSTTAHAFPAIALKAFRIEIDGRIIVSHND